LRNGTYWQLYQLKNAVMVALPFLYNHTEVTFYRNHSIIQAVSCIYCTGYVLSDC
jgi:hypothetical protein